MLPSSSNAPRVGSNDLSRLASIVTVRDIYSPFIGTFEAPQNASDVWEKWSVELCWDSSPLDHIGLVLVDGKPAGILRYEDIQSGKLISDCMTPIPVDALITEETSLIVLAEVFAKRDVDFFIVIKGNDLVGWLSYHDLHKLPFRLCLFAGLLGLEDKMLQVILRNAEQALCKLPADRCKSARTLYEKRHVGYLPELRHEPWAGMAGCTYFKDKALMLQTCSQTRSLIPAVCEEKWMDLVGEVRNALAHPDPSRHIALILERERFSGFMDWLGRIDAQLMYFLKSDSPLELPRHG